MSRPRAVITGAGVVCAFGVGRERLFDALAAGESAIGPIRCFDAATFPTRVAGQVPVDRVDAGWLLRQAEPVLDRGDGERGDRSEREAESARLLQRLRELAPVWAEAGRLRDRKAGFALLAGLEAWRQAGCGAPERGAWLCPALGLEQALLDDFAGMFDGGGIRWEREPACALPATRFRAQVDLAAALTRELFELTGPQLVHTSACAAGALSVAHAASLIERGGADVVLCGGADAMVNPLGLGGMSRLGAPSPRPNADACRPFDLRRDGLAMGEGAALFVVEAEDRARARGVRPLARVAGWGSSQDAFKATAPRPDGAAAARAMRAALAHAGLAPDQIGYINAHGTGTPLNDPAEARAIHLALGPVGARVPVSSIKGAVGHLMAASGAIELAACLLCFERDLLPGTAHHQDRDPAIGLDVIGPAPRPARVDAVLSNSFGFGGQNATVVLERWP
ncbi:beta-ketoacyl-[acyl-carrier-protein] synthase family protein [Haliangium sp.]|uniref:beta-ketoacyl-[acyl-carrier-protein] synthase family protein n=1 Tax=Haliangium sp. TaxID=2663208 RepID=UPI003D10C8AA